MFSMRTCRCCKPITRFADSPSSPFKSEFGNQRDKYGRSVKLISWACSSRPCTPCYCCHPCVFCVIFVYCWQFISFVSVMGSAFCLMHGCYFVCWMLFLQPLNQAKLRTTSITVDVCSKTRRPAELFYLTSVNPFPVVFVFQVEEKHFRPNLNQRLHLCPSVPWRINKLK